MILLGWLILAVLGIVFTIVGVRGRIVGDDPHCRACGFNLRGRDATSTPRCAECGADIADASRSIHIGVRLRRWRWLTLGLALGVLGAGMLGWRGVNYALDYNWAPWKPVTWLFNDLDSNTPRDRIRAGDELTRRFALKSFEQAKVDWVMDHIIARLGDPQTMANYRMTLVVDGAVRADRVSDERLRQLVGRAIIVNFKFKPKLRVGQHIQLSMEVNATRLGQHPCTISGSPLMLGERVLNPKWLQTTTLRGGGTYGNHSSFDMRGAARETPLVPGQFKVHAEVTLAVPFANKTVEVKVPVSSDVQVYPADATVDTFTTDPALREKMRAAFEAARLVGPGEVRLKVGMLPKSVAMDVVLVKDAVEHPVVSQLLIDANTPERWYRLFYYTSNRAKLSGAVDIHLRPSQKAADPTVALNDYWGEEIVIPGVVIDAPYDPPFVRDPSLRPQIESALSGKLQREPGGKILVSVSYKPLPVKLACQMILRWHGREFRGEEYDLLDAPVKRAGGYGRSMREPDPAQRADAYDIILRADPQWDIHAYNDLTPPWDGEIILQNVPVTSGPH